MCLLVAYTVSVPGKEAAASLASDLLVVFALVAPEEYQYSENEN